MKKIVISLLLTSLFFQNMPMGHRVTMKKMHERYAQPTSYTPDEQPVLDGEPPIHHRHHTSIDRIGSSSWSKKFMGLALCTMLVCAEAAPILARTDPEYPSSQAYEDSVQPPAASDAPDTTVNTTAIAERCGKGFTQFMHDAELGYEGGVKGFIEHADDTCINEKDHRGLTALMHAAKSGQTHIVRLLLEGGADADVRDLHHATASEIARAAGHTDLANMIPLYAKRVECVSTNIHKHALIRTLDELNFLLNIRGSARGFNFTRCMEQHAARFAKLIHCGAKLDKLSYHGSPERHTPLMLAAAYGYPKFVDLLLKAGAKNELVNREGRTAVDFIIAGAYMQLTRPDEAPKFADYPACIKLLMKLNHPGKLTILDKLNKVAVRGRIAELVEYMAGDQSADEKNGLCHKLCHSLLGDLL